MNSKQPEINDSLDLTLDIEHLYPPYRSHSFQWVEITTRIRADAKVDFSFEIDGDDGPFPGIEPSTHSTSAQLTIRKAFIENYQGTWPVALVVKANLEGSDLVETATLTLYDTRTMVADRLDITLNPSDRVPLPAEGDDETVAVTCEFFDANDVPLPPTEIGWEVLLNPPVAGVELHGSVIHVTSLAHSDTLNIKVNGPNGVGGNAVVKIIP